MRAEYEHHHLQVFLRSLGLGARQSARVVQRLGPGAEAIVRRDPYTLAGEVPGTPPMSTPRPPWAFSRQCAPTCQQ